MSYFKDRAEAGQKLAGALSDYKSQENTQILALPRGGIPIAYEIASQLRLPLNVFLVRKLGVPDHEELAMGAIAEENICILNQKLIEQLRINEEQIQKVYEKEKEELKRRLQLYRKNLPLPSLKDKNIILVDDGVATGATLKAVIHALKNFHPANIIIAVPVASKESLLDLSPLVQKIICLIAPENFYGVGSWYESFEQTNDETVIHLLNKAKDDMQQEANEREYRW